MDAAEVLHLKFVAEHIEHAHKRGGNRQHCQREPCVDGKHNAEGAEQRDRFGERLRHHVGKKPTDGIHVVVDTGHERTRALADEKAQRKPLHRGKRRDPQVVHRLHVELGKQDAIEHHRQRAEQAGQRNQRDHIQHLSIKRLPFPQHIVVKDLGA